MNKIEQTPTFAKNEELQEKISITGISSVSPLGLYHHQIWEAYRDQLHRISLKKFDEKLTPIAMLSDEVQQSLKVLQTENLYYKTLDKSVLFAILAARQAIKNSGWGNDYNFGVNIGSSRGATGLFETYHQEFLKTGKSSTLSSPTTTLGNISSWVAQDLQAIGPEISHSITCSTALHAIVNGVAWLQSGMANKFLVGGSEAPLTPFTIAQIKALKIYATNTQLQYPCQAMNLEKSKNSMFLGEGAAMVCLEKEASEKNAIAHISGIGYATEQLVHNISISTQAHCLQNSMKMALRDVSPSEIDAIVMHAPGTIKGDQAEYNAIKAIFGEEQMPVLTTNKWKIGHTFGASGALSLEMAILMIKHQEFIPIPYIRYDKIPQKLNKIIVNAVGFGGNAVSVLIEKPNE